MGLCNLKHIERDIAERKKLAELYEKRLKDCESVVLNSYDPNVVPNYGYFPVLFPNEETRNQIYDELKSQGIHTRKYFYPLTADQVCFKNKYKDKKIDRARDFSKRVLVLPIYPELKEEIVERVSDVILLHGADN